MELKVELSKESNIIFEDDTKAIKYGNNDFIFKDFTIKSFFVPRGFNKLYVVLSAIGRKNNKYPLFNRISWHDKLEGNVIFFDDPTRYKFDFSPCFYFGDLNSNVLDLIARIIRNLKLDKNISNDNIVFISSSNGGFATLYLCNEFFGSKCIALNPQLDIKTFFDEYKRIDFQTFKNTVGIQDDPVSTDSPIFNRINLYRIASNRTSKFVIYSNIACKHDLIQIDNFCKSINFKYHLGLNKLSDNFYLILVNAVNIDPHLVQPGVDFCLYFDKYFFDDSDLRKNDAVSILIEYNSKLNYLDFRNNVVDSLFSVLNYGSLYNPVIKTSGNKIDVFLNDNIYIRLSNFSKSILPNIRIKKDPSYLDNDLLHEFVKEQGLHIEESKSWVNIYDKPLPTSLFHKWLEKILAEVSRFVKDF